VKSMEGKLRDEGDVFRFHDSRLVPSLARDLDPSHSLRTGVEPGTSYLLDNYPDSGSGGIQTSILPGAAN
jgi:hypothetical protein